MNTVTKYTNPLKETRNHFDDMFTDMLSVFDSSPFSNSMLSFRDVLKRFNTMENSLFRNKNYPPFNLIEEADGQSYSLEFAVAGFEKDELEVSLERDVLTVKGQSKTQETFNHKGEDSSPPLRRMLHQGLARRAFESKFTLPDNSVVEDVTLKSGVLTIKVVKPIPEEKKIKLLEIK